MPRKPQSPPIVCDFFTWRLFQRDGVFYADGRTGRPNLGKHSLGTRDREEAFDNLRELDRRKAADLGLTTSDPTSAGTEISIPNGWDLFLSHCARPQVLGGACERTKKRYRAVRDKHSAFCASRSVQFWSQVNKASLEAYGNHLARSGYADRSLYLELTLLKSALRWLVDENHLPASSRVRLPLQKPQGSDTYCYEPEEVKAMIAHCRSRADLSWLADVIVALACTGLRISELASVRWTDFDQGLTVLRLTDERASVRRRQLGTVRTTKGRRDRSLPVHPDLREVLRALPRNADNRVLHGPRGGRLKPDTVRVVLLREVIAPLKARFPTPSGEIGFEHGRVHSLRHYFCSQAFSGGASEREIMDWLGHKDSKMVGLYRHLRPDESQRRMEGLDFVGKGDRTVRPARTG